MKYLLCAFFACYSTFLFADPDIKIIRSDKTSLVFEYIPQYTDTSAVFINSSAYKNICILNGNIIDEDKYGSPSIPVRYINIGVPQEFGNTFEVLSYSYKEIKGNIVPVAKVSYREGDFVSSYEINQSYFNSTEGIAKLLEIGSYVKLRGLPVQRLILKPVEFNASKGVIKLYKSIIVRVNYTGTKSNLNPVLTTQEDDLLKDAVINFDQSSKWIEYRSSKSLNKQTLTNSVLSEGKFFRFEAPEEGIYKIDRATLASLGININNVNPKTIKIYNNGGKVLPEDITAKTPDDLQEIAIFIAGQEDNKFDEGDYILFYGRGTQFWDYDSTVKKVKRYFHPYSVKNYYYITSGGNESKKRMQFKTSLDGFPTYKQSTTKAFEAKEEDKFNLLKTGRIYFGDIFTESEKAKSKTYRTKLNGIVENSRIDYRVAFGNKSIQNVPLSVYETDKKIMTVYLDNESSKELQSSFQYKIEQTNYTGNLNNEESILKLVYDAATSPSEGYLDFFEIFYTRYLKAVNEEIKFYSTMDTSGLIEYNLGNFVNNTSSVKVFDVSNYADVKIIDGTLINGGDITFRVNEDRSGMSKYIAAGIQAYKRISGIEEVPNQNLHGISEGGRFIIITHKNFLQEALRLKAHKESKAKDPMSTVVVTVDQIYNEFSATGGQDVGAIRNFIKYAFDNWTVKPEYVLMFGEGDYDYKNAEGKNQNFVIPYESENSFDLINSYCSDDFYGRVSGDDYAVDLAIGRINATTIDEAKIAVDKIIQYETTKDFGLWRNHATLVADDNMLLSEIEPDSRHTPQSENLSINILPPFLDQQKIYIADYPTVETGAGRRKPKANEDIIKSINDGTLILNYYGHGAPDLWAQEYIFVQSSSIPALKNENLFFLSALTCSFGQYDTPGVPCASEALLLKPGGGAIGVLSASRAVFPDLSEKLNTKFYFNLFNQHFFNAKSVGKAYFLAKFSNSYGSRFENQNDSKYHLFGDPTIKLNIPEIESSIDSINSQIPDSSIQVKALSTVKISGTVRNADSSVNQNFNGEGILAFYDSQRTKELSELGIKMLIQGGTIFKSRVSVVNGRFSTEFTVPKDISCENKNGKVVFYANNGQYDALGYTTKVKIGGTDTTKLNDGKGPDIEIIFDGELSNGNNLLGPNSNLKINLKDKTGLNTTGTGIGHKLQGILNDNENNAIDFTNYFIGDMNSGGKSGQINYQFNALKAGDYKLKVKAWDVFNNTNEEISFFNVVDDNELVIRDLFNYPNPFSSSTSFTFQHNLNSPLDIKIKVYTVAGRLIKVIEERAVTNRSVRIDWDGRDEDGNSLGNGTYLYKLIVHSDDNKFKKELLGKVAVIR